MPKTKSILMRFHFLIILVHYAIASQAQRNVRRLSGASLSPSTNWTTSPTPNSFTHSPSVNLSYPSPSPTPECHDLLDYKSPINDLPCWAFRNTDCLAWTYIGLTDSQLFELLQSCPQACNVECRSTTNPSFSPSISYRTLVADVEFYVYGIRNPLDLDAKAVFEEVVRSFVSSAFTNGTSTIVSFTIDDQTMLHDRVKRLRKRRLSDATLRIYGKIVVRTIDETLTANSLKALFSSMIDSSAFQERVKNESILPELLVSSSFRIDIGGSPDIDQGTPTNKNPRKKALTITSIVLVMCSVILFVGFLYRKQTQSRYSEQLSPDVKLRYIFNDPEEIAWEDTTRPHHNHVSAFNFEDELDKVESEYIVQRNTTNEVNIDIQFPKSPRPESSERTHIPSMIIFDNIDDEKYLSPSERSRSSTNSHDEPTHQQSLEVNSVKMGMPVKRVDASSELMKVLSAKKIQNPNQAYSLLL
jgi:hypothetical protein